MVRGDPQLPLLIDMARICGDLGEVVHEPMVFEDGLYEVKVGIAEYLQLTSEA